jgi:hypothetical protein
MTTSTPAPNNSTTIDSSTAQTEVLPDGLTQTAVLPDPAPESQPQAPAAPAAQAPAAAPAASSVTPAQSAYGYPANGAPYAYPPVRPTNVLGIITLVLGILGFALVPVITGHIALAQIKRTGDEGRGITIAGLVLGYVGLAGYVLAGLFFFGLFYLTALAAVSSY